MMIAAAADSKWMDMYFGGQIQDLREQLVALLTPTSYRQLLPIVRPGNPTLGLLFDNQPARLDKFIGYLLGDDLVDHAMTLHSERTRFRPALTTHDIWTLFILPSILQYRKAPTRNVRRLVSRLLEIHLHDISSSSSSSSSSIPTGNIDIIIKWYLLTGQLVTLSNFLQSVGSFTVTRESASEMICLLAEHGRGRDERVNSLVDILQQHCAARPLDYMFMVVGCGIVHDCRAMYIRKPPSGTSEDDIAIFYEYLARGSASVPNTRRVFWAVFSDYVRREPVSGDFATHLAILSTFCRTAVDSPGPELVDRLVSNVLSAPQQPSSRQAVLRQIGECFLQAITHGFIEPEFDLLEAMYRYKVIDRTKCEWSITATQLQAFQVVRRILSRGCETASDQLILVLLRTCHSARTLSVLDTITPRLIETLLLDIIESNLDSHTLFSEVRADILGALQYLTYPDVLIALYDFPSGVYRAWLSQPNNQWGNGRVFVRQLAIGAPTNVVVALVKHVQATFPDVVYSAFSGALQSHEPSVAIQAYLHALHTKVDDIVQHLPSELERTQFVNANKLV